MSIIIQPKVKVVDTQSPQDREKNSPGEISPSLIDNNRYCPESQHDIGHHREIPQLRYRVRMDSLHSNVMVEDIDVLKYPFIGTGYFVYPDIHLESSRKLGRLQQYLPKWKGKNHCKAQQCDNHQYSRRR